MTIESDGSVAAHVEEADVVKEDHAGLARRVVRFAEQRADNGVVAARLVDDGGADVIEVGAKAVEAFLDWAAAEIGAAGDDDARGLAAGVGIDYVDPSHIEPSADRRTSSASPARRGVRSSLSRVRIASAISTCACAESIMSISRLRRKLRMKKNASSGANVCSKRRGRKLLFESRHSVW